MGRDYGSALNGFVNGFRAMDDHFRGKEASERADRQLDMQQSNADREFGYRKERDTVTDTRYADETSYARGRDTVADKRYADETAYGRSRDAVADRQWGASHNLAVSQNQRAQQQFDWNKHLQAREESRRAKDHRLARAKEAWPMVMYQVQSGQVPDRDTIDTLEGTPLALSKLLDENYYNAAATWEQFIQSGDPQQANNPQLLQAADQLFADDIKEGVGSPDEQTGGTIVDKRVAGMFPGRKEGTMILELEVDVQTPDGKVVTRRAPVTQGRTSRDDDLIVEVDVERAAGHVLGTAAIARAIRQDPQFFERAQTYYNGYRQNELMVPSASARDTTDQQAQMTIRQLEAAKAKAISVFRQSPAFMQLGQDPAAQAEAEKRIAEQFDDQIVEAVDKVRAVSGRSALGSAPAGTDPAAGSEAPVPTKISPALLNGARQRLESGAVPPAAVVEWLQSIADRQGWKLEEDPAVMHLLAQFPETTGE